ncbi:Zinc finger domain-containing protein [Tolypocladium capitatum]|uniref:Zinc finger domain-containing protein n=1 Tax=Tolypocladium capitatum TaxID=45235 RepID=A0A2K3QLH1_9HYPO|nr:Zinc finger domain-containing protein [Tolypocladium capitatum]
MASWGATTATTVKWGTAPGGGNGPSGSVPSVAGETSGVDTGGMKPAGESNMNGNAGGDPPGFEHEAPTYTNGSVEDGAGNVADAEGGEAQKCFNCGEPGHRAAECPTPRSMECRFCKKDGHMVRDCPDKPPMVCENCGQDGHMRRNCENARKINRDHIADLSPDEAWAKLEKAVAERDLDDTKEAVQEYVKALSGAISYRDLQEAMLDKGINLFFIATERDLVNVFTNMDFQGNMGKKYSISYRFSEKPDRPREAESFPKSREELLERLDNAGEVVNSGQLKCHNCREIGHTSKFCTQERVEKPEMPKISCNNCNEEGHRLRDCPKPRVDKFACKNCGCRMPNGSLFQGLPYGRTSRLPQLRLGGPFVQGV